MEKTMLGELGRLREMTVGELRDEWFRLYGEPTRSRNRDFLWRRLAWRVQELAQSGLCDQAKTRLQDLASGEFTRARTPGGIADDAVGKQLPPRDSARRQRCDPRLPTPGTVITRQYRGRELRLVVLDDGFELDGQAFRSLSEAARAVTGARWNGPLFWGLVKRKRS